MAIAKIDNQAVGLVTPGNTFQDLNKNCNCIGQDFCQLSEPDDTPQFQLDLTEADGVELVTDGTFVAACGVNWTCGAGWTIMANQAVLAAGGAGNLTVVVANEINLRQDGQYKVVFTVTNYVGGGSGTLQFNGFAGKLITFTGDVTALTTYVDMDNLPTGSFFFTGSGGATGFRIRDFSIKEMSSIATQYKDLNGNIIFADDTNNGITYDYTVGKAQVLIDWNLVSKVNDCYNLCIIDKTAATINLIVNGDFSVPAGSGWLFVGDWTFPAGVAQHAPGAGSFASTLQQSGILAINEAFEYTLTFNVSTYAAGIITVDVRTTGGDITIGTAAAAGIFSFNFSFLNGSNIIFSTPNDIGDFQIDDIVLAVQDKYKAPVFETECFKLEDASSCTCATILMTWTNDENAFGFDYENFTFVQKMRFCAKLYQPHYTKDDKDTYRDSAGNRTLLYSSTTKIERLKITPLPEYMHDALSIGIEHDTVRIGTTLSPDDTVEYVNDEDDYEPRWENQSLLAPITLEMIKDDQNLVNSNC